MNSFEIQNKPKKKKKKKKKKKAIRKANEIVSAVWKWVRRLTYRNRISVYHKVDIHKIKLGMTNTQTWTKNKEGVTRRINWWFTFGPGFQRCCFIPRGISIRCFCWVLIFALLYAPTVIYLLPVMIHGWVRRPLRGPNKNVFLPLWKLRAGAGIPWSSVKLPFPPPPTPHPPSDLLLNVQRRYFLLWYRFVNVP